MGLAAGDFNRRITLSRPSVTRDAQNRPSTIWVEVASVAASWRRATANERLAAAQVSATVTDIFEIRYSQRVKDIDPTYRLAFAGRGYDLIEVTEIGFREGLLIRAAARVDQ